MDNIKVLIVSFYFPPYPKVGGRRWAKFAKYLNREGFDTHVLCVTFNQDTESPWNKDIEEYEGKIHRIYKDFYRPYYQRNIPVNIIQKIKWKVSYLLESYKKQRVKTNVIDPGKKYAVEIKDRAEELIKKHSFNTVIATGGPFSIPYEVVKLKEKFKEIQFIVDIRDVWRTSGKRFYEEEEREEKETYSLADVVTSSCSFIIKDIKDRMNDLDTPFVYLKHAFDKEDFVNIPKPENTNIDFSDLKMVYAGSLYPGMESQIEKLIEFIQFLKSKGSSVNLRIYSFSNSYQELFENSDICQCVNYMGIVPPLELSEKIGETSLILQFRPVSEKYVFGAEHSLSSKFYELIYYRKPILYLGPSGNLSNFLEKNNLGMSINSYSSHTDFESIQKKISEGKIPNLSYDVSQHEYRVEVAKLKVIINS